MFQISQLKISLRSVLDQWTQHKQAAEEISSHLTEGRYSISRLRLLTGSLEAAQLQEEGLQVSAAQSNSILFLCVVVASG